MQLGFFAAFLAGVALAAEPVTVDNFEAQRRLGTPLGTLLYEVPGAERAEPTRVRLGYDDVLWAARMVEGEGGKFSREHAAAILWTVAQRSLCPASRLERTFIRQMREFSQPINPIWGCEGAGRRTGRCARYCDPKRPDYVDPRRLPPLNACAAHKLQRRARFAHLPWSEIDRASREAALDFALGRLENPVPGAANFVADCRSHDKPRWVRPVANYASAGGGKTDSCRGVNSFYYEYCETAEPGEKRWSSDWPADSVRVETP